MRVVRRVDEGRMPLRRRQGQRERIGMRGNKKCAPSFRGQARKALDKAVCIIADGNAGYAAFGAMLVAWVAVMAVYACIG